MDALVIRGRVDGANKSTLRHRLTVLEPRGDGGW